MNGWLRPLTLCSSNSIQRRLAFVETESCNDSFRPFVIHEVFHCSVHKIYPNFQLIFTLFKDCKLLHPKYSWFYRPVYCLPVGAILYSGKLHYLKELLTERMTSTLDIMFIQFSLENTWIMDAVSGLLSSMKYQWRNT